MKNRTLATTVFSILLASCASNPSGKYAPVDPALGRALRDQGVNLLVTPTPDFSRMTGGDQAAMTVGMMFGAIGGGLSAAMALSHARSVGRTIVAENEIVDPTPRLAEHIREMLAVKYGSISTDSGLTVTVSTDSWALLKDDVAFNASVVVANATVDGKKPGKPLAKGVCYYRSPAHGPTSETLLADGAAQLKAELDTALEHCVQEFHTKLFL